MAAVNKDPFVRSSRSDNKPAKFLGLVKAGSSQAIKIGEICCFNKTAGYWEPVALEADFIYALAISAEEQKAADSARYMSFYSLAPEDQFEITLAAAAAVEINHGFLLTAAQSQQLTYSASGYSVAFQADYGHYPASGTTIRSLSKAVVIFNPCCTYWGLMQAKTCWGREKPHVSTSAVTLYPEQSGLVISNLGSSAEIQHVLPQTCTRGTTYTAVAQAAYSVGFDPGAAGAIYIEGAKQTDNKGVTVDDEGDSIKVTADGNGDWIGQACISSNADPTAAIDIQT